MGGFWAACDVCEPSQKSSNHGGAVELPVAKSASDCRVQVHMRRAVLGLLTVMRGLDAFRLCWWWSTGRSARDAHCRPCEVSRRDGGVHLIARGRQRDAIQAGSSASSCSCRHQGADVPNRLPVELGSGHASDGWEVCVRWGPCSAPLLPLRVRRPACCRWIYCARFVC